MLEQGAALLAAGRFHEAMAAFRAVLAQQPASAPARLGLARACIGAGDLPAATAWLSDAVRVAPGAPEPAQLLADVLLAQKLHAQASPVYREVLERFGLRTADNLLHAAFCLEQVGEIDAAAAAYRDAIAADANLLEAHVDLAGVLWRLEDFDGTLRHALQAVELAPHHAYAQRILGTAYLNLNRLDEAQRHLRRALELQPDLNLAQLDLAFTLLLAGQLRAGWPLYELRWRDAERMPRPAFFRPEAEWPGPPVPLAGKAIAVYAEQGLGDVLQFLRYLPRLQALGAQVRCVLQPELVPLVEASFAGVQCWTPGRDLTVQAHVAVVELAGRFGTTLDNIPAQVPYLRPPAAARGKWRTRMAPWAGRVKVGLAWSGSPRQVNNRNRAVPLRLLLPITEMPGVQCFSLQKGDAGSWTEVPVPAGLVDLTAEWDDFADSAAMFEQLDLVITVDTAVAHLAGALGKPVWILLPPNADWRWLLEREDSPWYPTARLFRRAHGEAREMQVGRVREALAQWLRQQPTASR